jgi:hypothetical protein
VNRKFMDGSLVAGVYMQLQEIPSSLPHAVYEMSFDEDFEHVNILHDRKDLHNDHGSNVHRALLKNAQVPDVMLKDYKTVAKVPTFTDYRKASEQLQKDREAAQRAVAEAPEERARQVVSTSALQSAMPAPSPSAVASSTRRASSGGARAPQAKRAAASPAPNIARKASRVDLTTAASSRSGIGRGGRAASSSVFGGDPEDRATSPSRRTSRGSCGESAKSVAAGAGGGGGSSPTGEVKLGGVRGLSKVVSITDILNGYQAGRELKSAIGFDFWCSGDCTPLGFRILKLLVATHGSQHGCVFVWPAHTTYATGGLGPT